MIATLHCIKLLTYPAGPNLAFGRVGSLAVLSKYCRYSSLQNPTRTTRAVDSPALGMDPVSTSSTEIG